MREGGVTKIPENHGNSVSGLFVVRREGGFNLLRPKKNAADWKKKAGRPPCPPPYRPLSKSPLPVKVERGVQGLEKKASGWIPATGGDT